MRKQNGGKTSSRSYRTAKISFFFFYFMYRSSQKGVARRGGEGSIAGRRKGRVEAPRGPLMPYGNKKKEETTAPAQLPHPTLNLCASSHPHGKGRESEEIEKRKEEKQTPEGKKENRTTHAPSSPLSGYFRTVFFSGSTVSS